MTANVMEESNSGKTPPGVGLLVLLATVLVRVNVRQSSLRARKISAVHRKYSISALLWEKGEVVGRTISEVWNGNTENVTFKIYIFLYFYKFFKCYVCKEVYLYRDSCSPFLRCGMVRRILQAW